jgi:uncharacterized membrane protein
MLTRGLVALAVAWPVIAGGAIWHRAGGAVWHQAGHQSAQAGGESLWATAVYLAGGQICHQRPERSFSTQGVQWPVCARCSGLYLAAPFGGLVALAHRRKWRARASARAMRPGLKPGTSEDGAAKSTPYTSSLAYVRLLALAAIPTALTLLWEWGGLGTPSNLWRFMTALPLGTAIMWVLVHVTEPAQVDRIN